MNGKLRKSFKTRVVAANSKYSIPLFIAGATIYTLVNTVFLGFRICLNYVNYKNGWRVILWYGNSMNININAKALVLMLKGSF